MKPPNLLLIFFLSWFQIVVASDSEVILSKFDRYIDLKSSRNDAAPDDVASYTVKIKKVRSELIEYGNQGVDVLLSEMASNPSSRRKTDIILFLDQGNLVNGKILSAVKKMALSQELDNLNPSVLIRSIDYLGNHGTQADIQLLESFNNHNSQGIPILVKLAIQRINKRGRGEM
ncbi:MAG: hypothetical protein QM496_01300 [Verrucomicrobiota bacterium]